MSITWIEVVDTAVKIGLGALISGVAGYVLATTSHQHALKKELITTKTRILEEACADAESYFSFVNKFYNSIYGLTVDAPENVRAQTDEEVQYIDSLQIGLHEALDSRNRARAKISLLGVSDANSHISAFNDTLSDLRSIVCAEGSLLLKSQFEEITDRFALHKKCFYEAANAYLEKTGLGRGA